MFSSILTRRLLWALLLCFAAFIVWLVPSFIVMAPDSSYAQRVIREAELVAIAIARGGMTNRPSSKIGSRADNPRMLRAYKRSPFNKDRAEGILRQMQAVTNKRIVLYDHRQKIVMDSYNFNHVKMINVKKLPDVNQSRSTPSAPERITPERITPPDYLPPPKGSSPFVVAALAGRTLVREIVPPEAPVFFENGNRFRPRQPIIQVSAPIRRLKLVQGAIVLIDEMPSERTAWRWRALFDSTPIIAATMVALLLLLLWLQNTMIQPLSKLAYGAKMPPAKKNDEINMIVQRQHAGQIAVQNFAETAQELARLRKGETSRKKQQHNSDSEMAARIHQALIDAKMEVANLTMIVQRSIHRHNMRVRHRASRQMGAAKKNQSLPFGDPVLLEKVDTEGIRNAFHLPLFAQSFELCLDYLIQGAAAAQTPGWPSSVRVRLKRQKKSVVIFIEDDGEIVASNHLRDWIKRAYDNAAPPLWTLRAIKAAFAMHNGTIAITRQRPIRLALTLPLSPHESESKNTPA